LRRRQTGGQPTICWKRSPARPVSTDGPRKETGARPSAIGCALLHLVLTDFWCSQNMASPLLLDREFLKTLEQVTLLCRTDLAGAVGSEHRSRVHGPGLEFTDYRHYSFGDDPRSVDWGAYLRLGKLFLKIYQTEQHIPVRILLDCSKS